MPDAKFLEEAPLYQRVPYTGSLDVRDAKTPAINMQCKACWGTQTFRLMNSLDDRRIRLTATSTPDSTKDHYSLCGCVCTLEYHCTACGQYRRLFVIKFSEDGKFVSKVGQEPPWEITVDKDLAKSLHKYIEPYKKGLINESQGYGIGAFSYYRRIVENMIDELLSTIADLIPDNEKAAYAEALEKAKKTQVTQEKIDLVKDLLPSNLRPQGMNPLGVLHKALSEGLHAETDEQCLDAAQAVKQALVYMIKQVVLAKEACGQFTEGMRRLLGKKWQKSGP